MDLCGEEGRFAYAPKCRGEEELLDIECRPQVDLLIADEVAIGSSGQCACSERLEPLRQAECLGLDRGERALILIGVLDEEGATECGDGRGSSKGDIIEAPGKGDGLQRSGEGKRTTEL